MTRLAGRAMRLFAAYIGVILALIAAGFIAQKVGIWAGVLWVILLVAAVVYWVRRRSAAAGG